MSNKTPALCMKRVAFWTNVTNLHSQHAIAKLGAVREGVLRQSVIKDGQVLDKMLYAATRDVYV